MRNTCRAILWAGGDRDLGWGPGHNPEKGSLSTAHRVLQAPPPRAGSTAPMPRVRLSAQPRSAHAPSAPGLDLRVRPQSLGSVCAGGVLVSDGLCPLRVPEQ